MKFQVWRKTREILHIKQNMTEYIKVAFLFDYGKGLNINSRTFYQ